MRAFLEKAPVSDSNRQLSHRAKPSYIMIIAEEIEWAETLQLELTRKGCQVSVIHDGLRGLFAIKQIEPDLVIISWSPVGLSGLEICYRLKSSSTSTPVILLTQSNSVTQRIDGLRAGANDCMSPSFSIEELFARIQANLGSHNNREDSVSTLRCADLQLNRKTREVFRGNRPIHLTAKEFDLLEYMMRHSFQVLTRTQILENVWGYDFLGNSNIIEVYIRYLRKKLETTNNPRLIHTVRSVGYILREVS